MIDTLTEHLRRAGSATSPRKAKSARRNGKRGGRPTLCHNCGTCANCKRRKRRQRDIAAQGQIRASVAKTVARS